MPTLIRLWASKASTSPCSLHWAMAPLCIPDGMHCTMIYLPFLRPLFTPFQLPAILFLPAVNMRIMYNQPENHGI